MSLRERYFTTGQAAVYLSVNRLTIRRWVQAGKLSGERIGLFTLIPRQEVEQLAAARKAFR